MEKQKPMMQEANQERNAKVFEGGGSEQLTVPNSADK